MGWGGGREGGQWEEKVDECPGGEREGGVVLVGSSQTGEGPSQPSSAFF